jgi:hypothetical protein
VEQQGSDGLKQECRAIDSTRLDVMPSVLALDIPLRAVDVTLFLSSHHQTHITAKTATGVSCNA